MSCVRLPCKRKSADAVDGFVEIFFEEAKKRAKELDEHLEKHGKPVGPLHGLPVSIKGEQPQRAPPLFASNQTPF